MHKILFFLFLISGNLYANTIIVTNSFDSGVGSLRNAINSSSINDTIKFSSVFVDGQNDTIFLDSSLLVVKPIVLVGNLLPNDTIFLSGKNLSKIMHIDIAPSYSGAVVLDSLCFIQGYNSGGSGGAICFMDGDSLLVRNSCFKGNTAEDGSGIFAIGSLSVLDCYFYQNTASDFGAAVFFGQPYSSLMISGSKFESNSADYGGAICAIYADHSFFTFIDNQFLDNNSINHGGAIIFQFISNSTVEFSSCHFEENDATNGGAIMMSNSSSVAVSVIGSTFSMNHAFSGGAIFTSLAGSALNLINSEFLDNLAYEQGGAYFNGSAHYFTLSASECLFKNNFSNNHGGAINYQNFCTSQNDIHLTKTNFINNTAQLGGGGAIKYDPSIGILKANNCLFESNNAGIGGGAISSIRMLEIDSCEFYSNYAYYQGGAICTRYIDISESILRNNSSNDGGAISSALPELPDCDLFVYQCQIDSNVAAHDGGAIFVNCQSSYASNSLLEVHRTTISNNTSGNTGGAIYNLSGAVGISAPVPVSTTIINESTISGNTAVNSGGIYAASSCPCYYTPTTIANVYLENSSIVFNNCSSGTGAINTVASNSNISVSSSLIAFNENGNFLTNGIPSFNSQGYNVLDDVFLIGSVSTDTLANDSLTIDIGPLQYNGGFGLTHLPSGSSVAVNSGNPLSDNIPQNHQVVDFIRDSGAAEYYCEVNFFDTIETCYGSNLSIAGGPTILGIAGDTSLTFNTSSGQGCDTIKTFHLEVSPVFSSSISTVICSGSDYLFPDGSQATNILGPITHSSVLTTINGCDSIINTFIEVSPNYTSYDTIQICNGEDYTFNDGTSILDCTADVDYSYVLAALNGCDSIINIYVEVSPEYAAYDTIQICSGNDYTFKDGTTAINCAADLDHASILSSIMGCDSIIYEHVSVISISNLIVQNQAELVGLTTMDSYQWVDCQNDFSPILGQQSFSFVPNTSGTYALIVSQYGCVDTSDCLFFEYIGLIDGETPDGLVLVYPNPVDDLLQLRNIPFGEVIKLEIIDVSGKRVMDLEFYSESSGYDIDVSSLESGIYNVILIGLNDYYFICPIIKK